MEEEYRCSSPLPRNPQRLLLHTITGVSRDHLCMAKSIPPNPGCVWRPIVVNVSQKFSASSTNQFGSASLDTPWVQCLKKGEAFDLLLLAVIAFINCWEWYWPFISCIKVCVGRVQKFIVEVEAPVAAFTAAHQIEFYSLGFHLLAKSWILHTKQNKNEDKCTRIQPDPSSTKSKEGPNLFSAPLGMLCDPQWTT
jgi:hypothetical protein